MFSPQKNLEAAGGVVARVQPHYAARPPQLAEVNVVLEIPLLDVGGLRVVEVRGACHRVPGGVVQI